MMHSSSRLRVRTATITRGDDDGADVAGLEEVPDRTGRPSAISSRPLMYADWITTPTTAARRHPMINTR